MKVAVLMGGRSAEREVSLMSGEGVLRALRAKGVDAHAFDPAERDLAELKRERFERCFVILHGRGGEDGTVQGALEVMGIPYTGSGVLGSAIAMDKWRTKMIWQAAGLPTPAYRILSAEDDWAAVARELGLPFIVKPANEGSTLGLTKVTERRRLPAAYRLAAVDYHDIALAERYRRRARVHGEHPGRERAAAHPHRGAARQLRLRAQVLQRRHEVRVSLRPAAREGSGVPVAVPGGVPPARLQRLGARGPDARRQRGPVAAGSEHRAGHDRTQPGADGGARRRTFLRGPLREDPGRRACGITRAS
jgi:hypothetical protein